ncbi:unnamed protein product [Aureobasidium pullulans]|nr:unnamed protein product [Aureobasidium pullulans]
MNVSGTLSFFRLFRDPSLCLPHHTVSTFNHLPIPLSRAFNKADGEKKKVDIRAVVLDKDNCFAVPKENEVYKPYTDDFPRYAFPDITQKPGCHSDVLSYLRNAPDTGVTHASQVAIVGDRLFTDVMMANMMGSYGFWIKDGVVEEKGLFVKLERSLAGFLTRRGYSPPFPQSHFE